ILTADELHIVDHQQIDRAELCLEIHRRLEAQCPDELIHKFFGREIYDLAITGVAAHVPGNRMHQMGLTETDSAVKKERVEGHGMNRIYTSFGDTSRCRVSQFVRLANDEILECKPLVKGRELCLVLVNFECDGRLAQWRRVSGTIFWSVKPGRMAVPITSGGIRYDN